MSQGTNTALLNAPQALGCCRSLLQRGYSGHIPSPPSLLALLQAGTKLRAERAADAHTAIGSSPSSPAARFCIAFFKIYVYAYI